MSNMQIGDCFEASFMLLNNRRDLILVHGTVVAPNGPLKGIRFPHGWCEDKVLGVVFDYSNKSEKVLPINLYYALGNIKDCIEYTYQEAVDTMFGCENENGDITYGFWDNSLLESNDNSLKEIADRGIVQEKYEEFKRS